MSCVEPRSKKGREKSETRKVELQLLSYRSDTRYVTGKFEAIPPFPNSIPGQEIKLLSNEFRALQQGTEVLQELNKITFPVQGVGSRMHGPSSDSSPSAYPGEILFVLIRGEHQEKQRKCSIGQPVSPVFFYLLHRCRPGSCPGSQRLFESGAVVDFRGFHTLSGPKLHRPLSSYRVSAGQKCIGPTEMLLLARFLPCAPRARVPIRYLTRCLLSPPLAQQTCSGWRPGMPRSTSA